MLRDEKLSGVAEAQEDGREQKDVETQRGVKFRGTMQCSAREIELGSVGNEDTENDEVEGWQDQICVWETTVEDNLAIVSTC